MKTFRVLMVVVFMLAAVATSVVDAQGQRVGFIRLLPDVNSNAPIQMQARRAFERMRPQLLALQKQGVILAFEPELKAGIVKLQYAASGADTSVFGDNQVYDNIHDSIVAPSRARTSLQAPREISSPSFYVEMYNSCFGASGLGVSSHVVGSLRDKTGRVVASYEGDADSSGEIYYDCFPWSGPYANVIPGYKLTFKVYDTTSALLGTFSGRAPRIHFTAINQTTAAVRGTGPAGKAYQVGWFHRNWNAADTWATSFKSGIISSAGTWAKDMSTLKFRGGDELDIIVFQNPSFAFINSMDVPHIYCVLGSNYCEISGFAFQPATLSIVHAGITHPFSGEFDASGYFWTELQNAGNPIFLKAGDRVSGTGVALYKLPTLTAAVDFAADVVSGKAPPNRYFELWAYTLCSCSSYLIYSHSNSAGNYSGDFASQVDLVSTQATNIEVYFQDRATGNISDYFRSFGP